MFEIDENNLPIIRTRQALLALDLQNDFVSAGSALQAQEPPELVEKIVNLVSHFRTSGNVVWVRSMFDGSRAVNLTHGESEHIITNKEVVKRGQELKRPRPSAKLLEHYKKKAQEFGDSAGLEVEDDEPESSGVSESFLTVEPGHKPQYALNGSVGINFVHPIAQTIESEKDLVFNKTNYSAFKDGSLVQILRSKFVTEIYICGVHTNISVFATAMDATRHGYSITIVDDCLGYRSKDRHDEALRQLLEYTGCDVLSSTDLIKQLKKKAGNEKSQQPALRQSQPRQKNMSLESLMSNLNLKREAAPSGSGTTTKHNSELVTNEGLDAISSKDNSRERIKSKIKTRRRPDSKSSSTEPLPNASQNPQPLSKHNSRSVNSIMDNDKSVAANLATASLDESRMVEAPAALCEGDTTVIMNLLSDELKEGIFEKVRDEVRWQKMSHQGGDVPRLVSVQGDVTVDGSIPIYRHPADESPPLLPFSPVVSMIRAEAEKKLGHSLNHVLIQFYRDGTDHISEHSDKTLDIVPKTFIVNVSLGAQRTIVFRTKKQDSADDGPDKMVEPRRIMRAPLPHNSMCKLGLVTNMRWLHAIRQDKRMLSEKSEEELAYNGGRISLTFRLIGTFLDKNQERIWGQGATSKTKEHANPVINGNTPEAEKMILAFGQENHSSEFDWAAHYGAGFDVLHMIANTPKLFLSGDEIADLRVKIVLADYGIEWAEGKLSPSFNWKDGSSSKTAPPVPETLPVSFVDIDLSKSTVAGDKAIMIYLDAVYGPSSKGTALPRAYLARQYTRFQQASELLRKWRAVPFNFKPFLRELDLWESFASEADYMAGSSCSLVDFALFPILRDVAAEWGPECTRPSLGKWYIRMMEREGIKKAIDYKGEVPT